MDISNIILHIEALIFASEKPLTSLELTELINNTFGFMEDKITLDQIESAIEGILEKYHAEFYPFEMKQSGGGWQFLTKKEYHKTVAQLNGEKFLKRLSAASLETLAIIAYKNPITKGEVESIRGVNSDYSIQKLLEKELIVITGRNEELPGKPLVYSTSKSFMDYFGINSSGDLPQIREILGDKTVEGTMVPKEEKEIMEEEESEGSDLLIVRGNGELIEEPEIVVTEETPSVDPELIPVFSEDINDEEEVDATTTSNLESKMANSNSGNHIPVNQQD
ncbi:MAG TPA: SMC-Scp complex subunit ScpB [Chitinophagaceae bacterium]|jgi:segregation and condensation protein B|nr:SMC-Scp complex subunit ScpB [Chitinophagaceae bacterium]